MDNIVRLEVEILDMKTVRGNNGKLYASFSGKSTKTGEVFKNLEARGISGASLVKDFKKGDIVMLTGVLEGIFQEKSTKIKVSRMGLSNTTTKENSGLLCGTLVFEPKVKDYAHSESGRAIDLIVKFLARDYNGNIEYYEKDGEQRQSRREVKIKVTDEKQIEILTSELGKRSTKCLKESEILVGFELAPKGADEVELKPTFIEITSMDSVIKSENWEVPDLKTFDAKAKNNSSSVDYDNMGRAELVEIATKKGLKNPDDLGTPALRQALKDFDAKAKNNSSSADYENMGRAELVEIATKKGLKNPDDLGTPALRQALKDLDAKAKNNSSSVDYENMGRTELVEIATKKGLKNPDDLGTPALRQALKDLDAKSNEETIDYDSLGRTELVEIATKKGLKNPDDLGTPALRQALKDLDAKSNEETIDYDSLGRTELVEIATKKGLKNPDDLGTPALREALKGLDANPKQETIDYDSLGRTELVEIATKKGLKNPDDLGTPALRQALKDLDANPNSSTKHDDEPVFNGSEYDDEDGPVFDGCNE